jgi:hypothetical protein
MQVANICVNFHGTSHTNALESLPIACEPITSLSLPSGLPPSGALGTSPSELFLRPDLPKGPHLRSDLPKGPHSF